LSKTKGYAAMGSKKPLVPFSFERREPAEGDVVIDIRYCGICHSDIHQAREEWGEAIFPMVPGHEIAGVVVRAGKGVKKFGVGDTVGVGCFVDSCRRCPQCTRGLEQYCTEHLALTYNGTEHDGTPTFGGYSATIVVKEDYVLRIPTNLRLDAAAPLLCAGITLYSPLKHWHAGPGKKVAIIGLGGLGHMGVKIAHAMGAEVTVFSQSLKKREDALRLGADHFYATSDPETFTKLEGQLDLVLSTISTAVTWEPYLRVLRVDGTLVLLGIPESEIPIGVFPLVTRRRSIAGSMIGGIAETQEMLDFCGAHNIASDVEVIQPPAVNEAYERILRSDVRYRFVIDMASLKTA
jgi:uncharacterized zinc-type alcohol dehydrogenase-like protein